MTYKQDLECLLYPDLTTLESALSATHTKLCNFVLCLTHGVLIAPLFDARDRARSACRRQTVQGSRDSGLSAALVRVLDHMIVSCQCSESYLDLMGNVVLFLDTVRRRILWMGQERGSYISDVPRRVRAGAR